MADHAPVSPLQPDAFFPWLARVVGRGGTPCEAIGYDATGALTFRLAAAGTTTRIVWRVAEPGDDWRRAVCLLPAGPEDVDASSARKASDFRQVVSRLAVVRRRCRSLPLLERRNRERFELRWAADALEGLCPGLLRPGVTRCAGLLFEFPVWSDGQLSLRFAEGDEAVDLVLRAQPGPGALVGRYGPLYLYATNEGTAPARHARVQGFVGYVLSLSTHPGMTLAAVPEPGQEADAAPVDPRKPAGDRTNPFFRHEYYACGMVISAMFTTRSRVLPVFHGNRECAAFSSYLTGLTETAYLHQSGMRPRHDFLRRVRTVDTSEIDAIMAGSQDELSELLRSAVEEENPELLIVMGTCVSSVIGDSVESSIRDARLRERGIKTISFETTASELDQHHQILWSALVELFDGPRTGASSPGANLIGYGHASDDVVAELTDLLGRAGIRRCASMVPRFEVAELETFAQADLNLLFPAPLVRESIAPAREKLRAPVAEIAPPFGIRGTLRWLTAVGSALGRGDEAVQVATELRRAWEPRWREIVRASKGLRLALVLTSDHHHEPDARRRSGVPLFEVTQEMGIELDVYVISPGEAGGAQKNDRAGIRSLVADHPDARVTFVQGMNELERAVRKSPSQLFYTEVPGDRRATSVGAVPISHLDFEMGLAGACRSLTRLQEAARTPFYQRYGRYLPCSDWSAP